VWVAKVPQIDIEIRWAFVMIHNSIIFALQELVAPIPQHIAYIVVVQSTSLKFTPSRPINLMAVISVL
jgi:hypothetical protein